MNLGRPKAALQLDREQRAQLEAMSSSRSLPHGLVTRARIVLLSADGFSNQAIAARLRLNQVTVGHWRRRFVQQGLPGLHEELRPGRPRSIPDERVAMLIRRTLRTKPQNGTSSPPILPGSTKWKSGSTSSPRKRSAEEPSAVSGNW